MCDNNPQHNNNNDNVENINILIGTNYISSLAGKNMDINNSVVITKSEEISVDTTIRGKTPGVHQTNSTIRRSIFIREETENVTKYAKINCKNSTVLDNHPTLNINDSEVVTAANLGSIANNMINGGIHTLIQNTSADAKITIKTTGNNSDIEIYSEDNLILSSKNFTIFEINNNKTVTIHNKEKTVDLFEFKEVDSLVQNNNVTSLTLKHFNVADNNITGSLNFSVGDKGSTTIKTVDSNIDGNTTSADLDFQVEGTIDFYDREGVGDDNKILTIECADDTKYGLYLNRGLYLSYKKHIPDANWTVTYTVPSINTHSTHFFDLNSNDDRFGVIPNGIHDGQILHLLFDNTGFDTKTLKLKFDGVNKLMAVGVASNFLIFNQPGQSTYLLWIDSKWRVVNTGAKLSIT